MPKRWVVISLIQMGENHRDSRSQAPGGCLCAQEGWWWAQVDSGPSIPVSYRNPRGMWAPGHLFLDQKKNQKTILSRKHQKNIQRHYEPSFPRNVVLMEAGAQRQFLCFGPTWNWFDIWSWLTSLRMPLFSSSKHSSVFTSESWPPEHGQSDAQLRPALPHDVQLA